MMHTSIFFDVLGTPSPVLSISPTAVSVGQSFTITCVFQTEPFLGSDIVFPNRSLFTCALEAARNGKCETSGTACVGNIGTCSADRLTYTLTVNNVQESLNDEIVFCQDSADSKVRSNTSQVIVLGKS